MTTLTDELGRWSTRQQRRLAGFNPQPRLEQVGRIRRIADGIAQVTGLPDTGAQELLYFPDGILGLAQTLEPDHIGCVLLDPAGHLEAGAPVRGSGQPIAVPVGDALLGRQIDPLARALDGGPPPHCEHRAAVERVAPTIIEREAVVEPLATGITVIDALFAIGRGQRELIIGDRRTGKTAIALDTMINQRHSAVISVYVAIGQSAASTRHVVEMVSRHGEPARTVFVIAGADSPAGLQWLAPYAGMAVAEYFRDRGQDVLIVFDDLSKHANVHRQISLLLRQPPGREAYPGDVFYLHARLLERAARRAQAAGGGSITALPIAETQAGNLSAYIPTNLISITDGQIFLDTHSFAEGQRPAVDIGRSVSRVGGKTQRPALRESAAGLRLDYTQFLELESFVRFGGLIDERTREVIEHGHAIRRTLEQPQYAPLPESTQVALLLALKAGLLDTLDEGQRARFRHALADWMRREAGHAMAGIDTSGIVGEADKDTLLHAVQRLVDHVRDNPPTP